MDLPKQWMKGVTSVEVYNTVFNVTEKNNSVSIQLDADLLYNVSEIKLGAITTLFEQQISSSRSKKEFVKLIREKNQGFRLKKPYRNSACYEKN